MKKYIIQFILLQSIIWTGPKLTPNQAADILYPNRYQLVKEYDGPKYYVTLYQPEWYQYNWRMYDQRRTYPYRTTIAGFTPQMQNRWTQFTYSTRIRNNHTRNK